MWYWLKKNRPLTYEIIQWAILALATAALIASCLR